MTALPQPADPSAALTRQGDLPLAEQLALRLAEPIRDRLLAAGTRLPSVRDCASRYRVSPSTVVAAYDRLLALGLVEARSQRGFYVRDAARAPASAAQTPVHRPAPVDAGALIRGMFQRDGGRTDPGTGTLPTEWLDGSLLQTAMRRTLAGETGLQYGEPAGDHSLREALSRRLADLGIAAAPSQIVTTQGATHALDVASRTLLQPGDAVLVDEPGWAIEYARLAQLGMRLLPVPRGPDGPDLMVMRALIAAHQPRLYVTVSVLHNPTGCSLPLGAAHQVLKLAEAHDFWVVEDDTYAYLAPVHAPRLSALDGLQRSIYVSGFSKILAPNWRVGFLAAPPRLVDRLVDTKMLGTLTTATWAERAVAWCLDSGRLRRHAERVCARLDEARERTRRLAVAADCRFVTPPQGLFGWVDVGTDTGRLARDLHADGWLTAPGSLFHAERRPTPLMRVNFAGGQDALFWQALTAARASGRPAQPA